MAQLGCASAARSGGPCSPLLATSRGAAASGQQQIDQQQTGERRLVQQQIDPPRTVQLFRLTIAHGWFEQPMAEDGCCYRRRRREPSLPDGHVTFATWSP